MCGDGIRHFLAKEVDGDIDVAADSVDLAKGCDDRCDGSHCANLAFDPLELVAPLVEDAVSDDTRKRSRVVDQGRGQCSWSLAGEEVSRVAPVWSVLAFGLTPCVARRRSAVTLPACPAGSGSKATTMPLSGRLTARASART